MKTISVVITSYNQEDYLREAIESVLTQTVRPFEIIVCDDASTDGSKRLIRDYESRYPGLVRGLLHEKNLGISKNRNSGIKIARGELVTWLDGDDRFRPGKLEIELQHYLTNADIKWVYSQVIIIDTEGNPIRERYKENLTGKIFERVISIMGAAPRNPLVELEALKNIGLFNEAMTLYEDFDLLLRLAKHYACSYSPEPMMEYRIHPGGIHNISIEKHLINFHILHNNLKKLLDDEPEDKRYALESAFLKRQNVLTMQKMIAKGQRFSALMCLCKEMWSKPGEIMNPETYAKVKKIVFSNNTLLNHAVMLKRVISKSIRNRK